MAFDPLTYPNAEDIMYVTGKPNPGIVQMSGWKRVYSWEVKKGKGVKGSTTTLNEYPPAEGTAKILLWLPEHFDQWNEFRPLLKYDPTKKTVSAVDFYHPSTEEIDVTSVVCKSIGARVHEGKGLYSITLELMEFNPPPKKSAVTTPKASKAEDKKTGSGDPIADAQQAEIARLLKQAGEP